MMWWFPQILGEGGIWPMFFGGLFYGLYMHSFSDVK